MKKFFKIIWKRLFCKHDYWWSSELTCSDSRNILNHQVKIIACHCSKCGKEKEIKFKKRIDK